VRGARSAGALLVPPPAEAGLGAGGGLSPAWSRPRSVAGRGWRIWIPAAIKAFVTTEGL